MKPLRALGVIALMVAALLALIGAGSASATVLCTNSTCATTYPSGTKVSYTLKSGTSSQFRDTSGSSLIGTCTESTMSGKTSSESGTTISSTLETFTWGSCSGTTNTLKKGSLSIAWTTGTSNGTVSASSSEVTMVFASASCIYGPGTSTTLGTLTGGATPVLAISAVLSKISGSFLCPSSAKWTAEYVVTEPHALYVGNTGGGGGGEEGGGGGATSTTLSTSLSGEGKSGEEITVNEGSKVKDTATLSGTNASKATGIVKYSVYADEECKELVTEAGEVTVSEGKVPASEEQLLEPAVYYWQAEYSGDSNHLSSSSTCGKEVSTVIEASNRFEAAEYPALVSGEQTESHTLTLEGEFAVKCSKVDFSGELVGSSGALTLTPTYSECTEGGSSATLETNGCQYVLRATENTSSHYFNGTQEVFCPSGGNIVVKGLENKCEAKIGSQSNRATVTYHSELEATPPNVTMEENLSSIHYTVSKDEGACPFSGTGEKTSGSLKGPAKLEASVGVETIGIAVSEGGITRLCPEEPKPLEFTCPKKPYAAGTVVKGKSRINNPSFNLLDQTGASKREVICPTGSNLSFKTKEEANDPLPIESMDFTFAGCETGVKPNNTQCKVEMKNAGATDGNISAGFVGVKGQGSVTASEMRLTVDCGTVVEQCEYMNSNFAMKFLPGAVPEITLSNSVPLNKVAGNATCFKKLRWSTHYEITQPQPAWVTF